ncbi:MAG: hypothetical protein LBO65_09840 [Spirochaetaceae bacterium]|jgi:hypothetical protein|nr:hypothetical protein [Spirochaetaceae bacterium]
MKKINASVLLFVIVQATFSQTTDDTFETWVNEHGEAVVMINVNILSSFRKKEAIIL